MNIEISASILSADFTRLADEIHSAIDAGIDSLHFDIMDGHFVPNLTFGPLLIKAARKVTDIPFAAHLMVENADQYIDECIEAGARTVQVHQEACIHLHRSLSHIRSKNARAGVVVNPSTPLTFFPYIADVIDEILIMTVNPGFSAQSLITAVLPKIEEARRLIDRSGRAIKISVDGGVKRETFEDVARRGADIVIMASALFGAQDRKAFIEEIRQISRNL
jgi:ribulose-phosphate 3-epimerase